MVDDLCQARKAENTDPRTNHAVKYATAHGRLRNHDINRIMTQFAESNRRGLVTSNICNEKVQGATRLGATD